MEFMNYLFSKPMAIVGAGVQNLCILGLGLVGAQINKY